LHQILNDVAETKCIFQIAIKKFKALQKSYFVSITGAKNWDEADEKFQEFTTVQMLEPYKKIKFREKAPERFVHCKEQ